MRLKTILTCLAMTACADPIAPEMDGGADAGERVDSGGGIPSTSGEFRHEVEAGEVTTRVNASDESAWQHLDLDTGLSEDDDARWDLAFSRFRIRINGGVGGPGGVQVAPLEADYASVSMAPDEGWTAPIADGEDDDMEPDTIFNGVGDWYDYDPATHMLTSKGIAYAIASSDGRFFKLRIDSYYDDAGSPGNLTFTWAEIDAPAGSLPDAGGFDAGDGGVDAGTDAGPPLPPDAIVVGDTGDWVYLQAGTGIVTITSPLEDLGWDLAVRRTEVRTNSGASGAGRGGAREDLSEVAFADLTEASTFDFEVDEVVDTGMPGRDPSPLSPVLANWYDYNPSTHSVTPGDRTYIVRTANGDHAKLRVWTWRDGEMALSLSPIERLMDTRETTVDAADAVAWAYIDLSTAMNTEVADASTDLTWDVGLSRTRARTNGGTSGGGEGSALDAMAVLDSLGAPSGAFVVDESMAFGPPGSPEFDGNAALGAWYDYDPVTHVVSPKSTSFFVRTAEGDLAAVQITSWEDGVFTMQVRYAGPNAEAFR